MRRAAAARMRCDSCVTAHPCRRGVHKALGALTCSSNRVMTAWTHSTGFCAAMAAHACTSAAADDDDDGGEDNDEVEEERTPFPRSTTLALLDPRRAEGRTRNGSVFGLVGVRNSSMPPWQCRKFESSDPAKQQHSSGADGRWKHECACASRERASERERLFLVFILFLSLCL